MIEIKQAGDPGFYEEFLIIEKFKDDVLTKYKKIKKEGISLTPQKLESLITQMAIKMKPIKAMIEEGAFGGSVNHFAEFLLSQMIRNGSVKIKTPHEP